MRLEKSQKFALVTFGTRNGLILVPRLWEHLVSAMQIQVFDLLQGNAQFEGETGGCLESLYDIFDNSLADSMDLCQKYKLFPDLSDWEGRSSC